jgi:hypothetical protein
MVLGAVVEDLGDVSGSQSALEVGLLLQSNLQLVRTWLWTLLVPPT